MNKPPIIPPRPTKPTRSFENLDARLVAFLDEQERADIKGTLERMREDLERYVNLHLQAQAENQAAHNEMRGDMRGLLLRVGALERGHEKHTESLDWLRQRAERHENDIDNSKSWIITDLDKKKSKAEERLPKIIAIVATIVAIVSGLLHLLR